MVRSIRFEYGNIKQLEKLAAELGRVSEHHVKHLGVPNRASRLQLNLMEIEEPDILDALRGHSRSGHTYEAEKRSSSEWLNPCGENDGVSAESSFGSTTGGHSRNILLINKVNRTIDMMKIAALEIKALQRIYVSMNTTTYEMLYFLEPL